MSLFYYDCILSTQATVVISEVLGPAHFLIQIYHIRHGSHSAECIDSKTTELAGYCGPNALDLYSGGTFFETQSVTT